MKECPFCKSNSGYYLKIQVRGSIKENHNFDGSAGDNTEMYDKLSTFKESKYAYCHECNKRLFKTRKKCQC